MSKEQKPAICHINNVVLLVYFDGEIDLEKLYYLMPVVKTTEYINSKEKIPFMGINNIIVNKSYCDKNMGIRQKNHTNYKSNMNKILSIDVQIFDDNYHIKISNNNFHIPGVKSEHLCLKIINTIINLMKYLQYLVETTKYKVQN